VIDDLAFVETLIQQRLASATVFQANTDASEAEIDVQNVPGKSPRLVRVLFSRANAAALRADPALAERVLTTLQDALEAPSNEEEVMLDLRDAL
jgi:hypothetical protein